ncbi:DUF502 domain-containing protein [Pirellulaceae bacterium]|nr:DUF502 domain-containing protein [Pirellulaceae bacterium]
MSKKPPKPFRAAILRGLGVVLPPLLTIALFIWAWSMINNYILRPVDWLTRTVVVASISDIQEERTETANHPIREHGPYIPYMVYQQVSEDEDRVVDLATATPEEIYDRYVTLVYLKPWLVAVVFMVVFIIALYFIGELLAAKFGRFVFAQLEKIINRIPLIRNVYSSVKQVTDFLVGDHDMEFNQVVAVQYPSAGIWSIGFVTGSSMRGVRDHVGEEMISVLMPTSPMPATGFTVTIPKSKTIELDLTIDQAIQFVVSCGVVVPFSQLCDDASPGQQEVAVRHSVEAMLGHDTGETDAGTEGDD